MHEVVHLSFGPQADALNCEFYNQQQKYFVYKKSEIDQSHIDPHVRFSYGTEFTPRALFWDYRNGFGKKRQFRHDYEGSEQSHKIDEIRLPDPVGAQWADRAQFPIHQSSMHKIPDWEIYPNHIYGVQRGAPEGQDESFELKGMGEEQFSATCHIEGGNSEDYLDFSLRPQLERCDLLEGVNLLTDLGGWGGFSTKLLSVMRDNFVPKQPIYSWALSRPLDTVYPRRIPLATQLSRVEMIAEMSEFSSLVIPLLNKSDTDFIVNARAHMLTFESMCLLSSLRRNRVSMECVVQNLTRELPQANIVQANNEVISEFSKQRRVTTRNKITINRPSISDDEELDSRIHHAVPVLTASQEGTRENQETIYNCPQNSGSKFTSQTRFEVNDRPLALRELVRRFASHDLRELVGDLTDNYVWRWESDSDSD